MNKLLKIYVSEIVKDTFDKALEKSNKRRKEFRQQWQQENPPRLGSSPNSVTTMRETWIRKIQKTSLSEADPPTTTPDTTGDIPPIDTTATQPPTTPMAPTDPTAVPGGSTPGATLPGTDPNAPPTDAAAGISPTTPGDIGGGGLGGMGGGGGAIGPGPTDSVPPTTPAAGEGDDTSVSDESESEESGDPISSAVEDAQKLLDQTRDIPTILKSVKQVVQDKFEKPDHALGLVKALYDTDDSTLRSVAVRLYQFIKAE